MLVCFIHLGIVVGVESFDFHFPVIADLVNDSHLIRMVINHRESEAGTTKSTASSNAVDVLLEIRRVPKVTVTCRERLLLDRGRVIDDDGTYESVTVRVAYSSEHFPCSPYF